MARRSGTGGISSAAFKARTESDIALPQASEQERTQEPCDETAGDFLSRGLGEADQAELRHQRGRVDLGPVLDDLAALDPVDGDRGDLQVLAGRRDAGQRVFEPALRAKGRDVLVLVGEL